MKLINVVKPGEVIPYGLSLRERGRDHLWELLLMLPVAIWYRRHVYEISNDVFTDGWFVCQLFIALRKGYGSVFDIRLAYGWTLKWPAQRRVTA